MNWEQAASLRQRGELFSHLTPKETLEKLEELYKNNQIPCKKSNMNNIRVSSYGIFILSIDQFTSFLKEERKSRVKKVLQLFQKEQSLYQKSIQTGSWLQFQELI